MAITPEFENGVGEAKEQRVDHLGRARRVRPRDVEDDGRDDGCADPPVRALRLSARAARQIARCKERLHRHQRHRDDTGEPRRAMDDASPSEQRACADRRQNSHTNSRPDQDRADARHGDWHAANQTGLRTKCASRPILLRTGHDRTQKHRLEVAAVVGEVAVPAEPSHICAKLLLDPIKTVITVNAAAASACYSELPQ
jgi:hypothetical protein